MYSISSVENLGNRRRGVDLMSIRWLADKYEIPTTQRPLMGGVL
jgi:hypothetical protein